MFALICSFSAVFLKLAVIVAAQSCITPNGTPGTCIDYKNCSAISEILSQPFILPNSTIFLINSFCEPSLNVTKVCCENKLPEGRRCVNPKLQLGFCTGIHQCPELSDVADQAIYPEHALFAMKSSCGPSQKSGIFSKNPEVCCLERRKVGARERSDRNSTAVNNSTAAVPKVTTSVDNNTGDDDNCENPLAMSGKCIGIKECQSLLSLIRDKESLKKMGDFLRRSLCGGTSGKHNNNVCCPSFGFLKHENMALLPDKETCGIISSPKVFGGTTADLGEFPWMVLIRYSRIGVNDVVDGKGGEEGEFGCGAVLLNDRYALTAAHCVTTIPESFNLKLKDVRLGEYDITTSRDCINVGPKSPPFCSDDVIDMPVEEVIVHSAYDINKQRPWNDIALLRFGRRIEYTEYIKPICLPSTPNLLLEEFVGTRLHIAGWGFVDKTKRGTVLQKLQVPVRANAWCIKRYKEMNLMTMKQICAGGEEGKDSCNGDSGGPLMVHAADKEGNVNWYAAGIVSFGPTKCGLRGVPAVYSRVNSYMDWIVSNMKP